MNALTAHAAYQSNAVSTASPARLLVMLLERLVLDVERGRGAQQLGDWESAHKHLIHAQDIVLELESSLQVDKMQGGAELAALYAFLRNQLVQANIRRDPQLSTEALGLAQQMCDTWREAAMAAAIQ
ncbi:MULTISPECIES: flagellar export chaperone FliS [unclassified Nocardioides]|uniref:flagellar export chaperone FliS n=1 Tax=unclassified Nocardioides TaxID=2615069 RepID=UPI0006F89FF3|nr:MULTISPECIES: flagellar export chaperone FliS [unclassified Nocardioides]KRA31166.1 hypothetical protein ASD81_16965 [Nocardioides sp. Root614]KRA87786.1 hypothetical protein ASD84_17235 [Nocardioides sp. Root682]